MYGTILHIIDPRIQAENKKKIENKKKEGKKAVRNTKDLNPQIMLYT